jgi:predicted DNA-binding transcriptional regulator AlpA
MVKNGTFPKIVKIGARASGFLESEVEAFIASRVAARDSSKQ